MSTLAAIEHALTVIDSQRGNLGVEIAQAALQALESQHTILQAAAVGPEKSPQRKQVTILFAHINGLTAFVDATPGHHVLNLTRQLWQRLDAAKADGIDRRCNRRHERTGGGKSHHRHRSNRIRTQLCGQRKKHQCHDGIAENFGQETH